MFDLPGEKKTSPCYNHNVQHMNRVRIYAVWTRVRCVKVLSPCNGDHVNWLCFHRFGEVIISHDMELFMNDCN